LALDALDQLRQRFGVIHARSNKGIRTVQEFQQYAEGGKIGVCGVLGAQRGDRSHCARNIPASQGNDDIVGEQGSPTIEEYVELLHVGSENRFGTEL
jgi:hypothetical protein